MAFTKPLALLGVICVGLLLVGFSVADTLNVNSDMRAPDRIQRVRRMISSRSQQAGGQPNMRNEIRPARGQHMPNFDQQDMSRLGEDPAPPKGPVALSAAEQMIPQEHPYHSVAKPSQVFTQNEHNKIVELQRPTKVARQETPLPGYQPDLGPLTPKSRRKPMSDVHVPHQVFEDVQMGDNGESQFSDASHWPTTGEDPQWPQVRNMGDVALDTRDTPSEDPYRDHTTAPTIQSRTPEEQDQLQSSMQSTWSMDSQLSMESQSSTGYASSVDFELPE